MTEEADWYFARRVLDDGRVVYAWNLTYGRARLGISPDGLAEWFSDEW